YSATIEWIAFGRDGGLATSAADGKIRLYERGLKLSAEANLPNVAGAAERPWGLAFSPDGLKLAVGSRERPPIRVFAVHGLRPLQTLAGAPQKLGALSVVAWSADGSVLAAAGSYKDGGGRRLIKFWQRRGQDMVAGGEAGVARDTITDLAVLDDGRAVYVS